MNIVILSNQSFDQKLKTNKWHVATRLAKMGHKVLFVDLPLRAKAVKGFLKGSIGFKHFIGVPHKREENLYVLKSFRPSPIKNIERKFPPLDDLFSKYLAFLIKRFFKGDFCLWIYHIGFPNLIDFIDLVKPKTLLYDVVDEYSEFPEYQNYKTYIINLEKTLIKKADLCFASAPSLFTKILAVNKNSYYLPNAGDYELFSKDPKTIPVDIKNIPKPIIGFAGALDNFKVDLDLVVKCAKELANISFVLIGPEKVSEGSQFESSRLKDLKNVYLLGEKNYLDLPSYYYNFNAYYIPYRLNEYTKGVFPAKFFDPLTVGLPTIVTNLPSYEAFKKYAYISKSDDEFIVNIKKALKENSKDKILERQKVAHESSWDNKVKKQLELIKGYYP